MASTKLNGQRLRKLLRRTRGHDLLHRLWCSLGHLPSRTYLGERKDKRAPPGSRARTLFPPRPLPPGMRGSFPQGLTEQVAFHHKVWYTKNVSAASYIRGLGWGFWKITQLLLIHTEEKVMERLGLFSLIGGKAQVQKKKTLMWAFRHLGKRK